MNSGKQSSYSLRLGLILSLIVFVPIFTACSSSGLSSELEEAYEMDSQTRDVLESGGGEPVEIAQTAGDYTATLERTYADNVLVVLGLTVESPEPLDSPSGQLGPIALAGTQGKTLEPLRQGSVPTRGDDGMSALVLVFDAGKIDGIPGVGEISANEDTPEEVDLELRIEGFTEIDEPGWPMTFDFTTPIE